MSNESNLQVNFDDVPDQFEAVDPGTYTFRIEKVGELKENKNKDGENIVLSHSVDSDENGGDTPMKDKRITTYTSIKTTNLTNVKRLFLAYGVRLTGTGNLRDIILRSLPDLVGKRAKAIVIHEAYTNPSTKETRMNHQIKDFLIPANV